MLARRIVVCSVLLVMSGWSLTVAAEPPAVISPPESFFQIVSEEDRDAARGFYAKYINVEGMPVVASAEVARHS